MQKAVVSIQHCQEGTNWVESYGPVNKATGIMRTDALFMSRGMSQNHLISNDSEMCEYLLV